MDLRRHRLLELLDERAFRVNEVEPFTLASGRKSPYYIDCKAVTLDPEGLNLIGALVYELLKPAEVSAVGGLTLGADPVALATAMHSATRHQRLRAFIVRKEPKTHGTRRWIEGELPAGTRVAIVDDVVTSGGSIITAAERARDAGLVPVLAVAVVDREEGAAAAIESIGVPFRAVVTRCDLLALRARHAQAAT